ncbi:MAG: hypothetical protein KC431_17645, partial [Myxococcales bacterium]|nr:hypothetical protein [Myxococcales bacterium]
MTQEELEALYRSSKERVDAEALSKEVFDQAVADLRRVAEEAEDAHLRANASLLLGALHDERGDRRSALSFYRQAKELVPDDASTHAVLAMTLAENGDWEEAIAEQFLVVELAPDDLTGWLLLGEMHIKAGKLDEAPKVYGAYELRRHGLLEGLTAKQDGAYVKDEEHRAGCVEALAPAADNGTAMALMFALENDPAPVVRERLALVMGDQRLTGYLEHLKKRLAVESDPKVQEAMKWAIEEIERDPVETNPGAVPEEIRAAVEAEEKALAAQQDQEEGSKPDTDGAAPADKDAAD